MRKTDVLKTSIFQAKKNSFPGHFLASSKHEYSFSVSLIKLNSFS